MMLEPCAEGGFILCRFLIPRMALCRRELSRAREKGPPYIVTVSCYMSNGF